MQRLVVKAAAAAVRERGAFAALASTYGVDRQGERVARGAFTETIRRWQNSGKQLPLHWNHEADADRVIGSIDPATMAETERGLYVKGQFDLEDSATAREAWRSVKGNRVGLSIGFLTEKSHKDVKGVRGLDALHLFEISLVPAPANEGARILGWKSAECPPHLVGTSLDPLTADHSPVVGTPVREDWDYDAVWRDSYDAMTKALEIDDRKSLPVRIATFEVD